MYTEVYSDEMPQLRDWKKRKTLQAQRERMQFFVNGMERMIIL